ncbi:MAG: type IX secretion system protein PorQ [Bacteroidales bacterium]|nr:type IX secretion system protein PorQ [Bacteroidales bacterium]
MKRTTLTLLTLMLGLLVHAQEYNGTYSFLRATNSARVAALGGLPLPVVDGDIQLAAFNPAAINDTMNNKLGLSYVDYFSDINFATAQYSRTFDKVGSFSATVQYHNYGRFSETTESGMQVGEFSASDYAVILGWGRSLTPHWGIGASMKYAGFQREVYASGALAVDVAGYYRTDNGWLLSLTARNIGVQLFNNYDYRTISMPWSIDFGASKRLEHLPLTVMLWYDDIQQWQKVFDDPLDLEGNYDPLTNEYKEENGFIKFTRNLATHFVIGGELNIGKNLVLRAAYNYGQRYYMDVPKGRTLVGFSAGVGVKIKMFEISYARSRMSIENSPNYVTITMDLNKF